MLKNQSLRGQNDCIHEFDGIKYFAGLIYCFCAFSMLFKQFVSGSQDECTSQP